MITIARYDDCKIPDYALVYLVNNDSSGLEPNDKQNIDSDGDFTAYTLPDWIIRADD